MKTYSIMITESIEIERILVSEVDRDCRRGIQR